jgi:hypothetical protein
MVEKYRRQYQHYVYILFRPDTAEPFYVGKGKGDRWLDHEKKSCQGVNPHKDRIVAKAQRDGLEIPKVKIAQDLTLVEAAEIERAFIAAIGREPDGPLVNLTAGGEGGLDPSPEVLAKLRRPHSVEHNAAVSIALTGRTLSPGHVLRMAQAMVGFKHREETKQQISRTTTGRKLTPEHAANISAAKKGVSPNLSEEQRARKRQRQLGRKASAETIAKRVAKLRGQRRSVKTRAQMSASQTARRAQEREFRSLS